MDFRDILMTAATQGGGAAPFIVNAVDFDGTNDYLEKTSDFTGAANSSTGILSAWARIDGGNGATLRILRGGGGVNTIERQAAGYFNIIMNLDGGGNFTFQTVGTSYNASATWLHILASWNTNFTAGNKLAQLYINDVSDCTVSSDTQGADVVNYLPGSWEVSGDPSTHALKFNGCLSEVWFGPGQYLDFSVTANRRKFISAGGKPVDLGATGNLPTGTAPKLYLKNAAATAGTNSGTGGNFVIGGAPGVCSTSPSG